MSDLGFSFEMDTSALEGMFPKAKAAVRRGLAKHVSETAFKVVKDAQDAIQQEDKTGRIYYIGGETTVTFNAGESGDDGPGAAREKMVTFNAGKVGREHQASAPDEAPANLYGALANTGRVEDGANDLEKEVVFGTAYGAAMEFGTVAIGGDIEPRPFVGPSCDKNEEPFLDGCRRVVAEGMAEGSK